MKKLRKARRFIAVLLTVTLVTQLTPPTLFADPVSEDKILDSNMVKEEAVSQVLDEQEEKTVISTVSDGTAEDINQFIPEKWKGMRYSVFTGNNQNMAFYNYSTSIYGNVHSNGGFVYYGSKLHVDGKIESVLSTVTETSGDGLYIKEIAEQAESITMPMLTEPLRKYIGENGTTYPSSMNYEGNEVVLEAPIAIDGMASFRSTRFLGKGIVMAKDSISYSVGEIATPADSRILMCSEDGDITLNGSDITLNAVLYAPHGCVYVNASTFTLNGRIIADRICINGSMISINAGNDDYDMMKFIFEPQVRLQATGIMKENRKVTLDIKELDTDGLIKEDTIWTVEMADGSDAEGLYAFEPSTSNDFHKDMAFKEAGNYLVKATVTNGYVSVDTQVELVIIEDKAPIANFTVEHYFTRDKNGDATIELEDNSYSPDGDEIGSRIWTLFYDENNDSEFTDDEKTVISNTNETEITYTTKKVGNYKIELSVKETFDDTIPSMLEQDIFLTGDTSTLEEEVKEFTVGNKKPKATIAIEKAKAADIVFTVGSVDDESMKLYGDKIEQIKKDLEDSGIDAKISTVSSSVLTAKDTFAWQEFSHDNIDGYDKHIVYNEKDIVMRGYYYTAYKDFLYVPDENDNQKVFEFDLQRDNTDWHSMEGGGFLFNTTISLENNTIKGFCVLVAYDGLRLVSINCNNLKRFRDGSYRSVEHAGKRLRTIPIDNVYANHHFKIVADKKTVSIWDGDKLILDNCVLPEMDSGFGYGPIISHDSHSCRQRSYFTFKNITMRTITGTTLSDIVNDYKWREGANKYVIHLSNQQVPELNAVAKSTKMTKALLENETPFILIGNETNQAQGNQLLSMAQVSGMFLGADELSDSMDILGTYIRNEILSKDYNIKDIISTDDRIHYIGYYADSENDHVYKEQ
ncbi:MAG: hypothetical protein IKL07_04815, partial [Clostridium sp.]|nr:hypothetical protein [Clostridium sp.]